MATGHNRYGAFVSGTPGLKCGGLIGGTSGGGGTGGGTTVEPATVGEWAPDYASFGSYPPSTLAQWLLRDATGAEYAWTLGANDYSIEAWIYPMTVVLGDGAPIWCLFLSTAGALDYTVVQWQTTNPSVCAYRRGAFYRDFAVPNLNMNERWNYLVLNCDRSGNMQLFVNNISAGTVAINATVADPHTFTLIMQANADAGPGSPPGADGGHPFNVSSVALHGRILSSSERQRSFIARTVFPNADTFCAYRMRDAIFTRGTTALISSTSDVYAETPISNAALNEYSQISQRGVGTDVLSVILPDIGPNGNHCYQEGLATGATARAWRFAPDSFFWRAP
jgi:hypothetical protein